MAAISVTKRPAEVVDLTNDHNTNTAEYPSAGARKRQRTSSKSRSPPSAVFKEEVAAAAAIASLEVVERRAEGERESEGEGVGDRDRDGRGRVDGEGEEGSNQPSTEAGQPQPSRKDDLWAIPELADRFVPSISADGTIYRDARKFSVKPPFWRRWTGPQYTHFARYLSAHFDPVPFARDENMPVEEVQHIFDVLVCNPLYEVREACRRANQGMDRRFELFNKYGTAMRFWGNLQVKADGTRFKDVKAELESVGENVLHLVTEKGNKYEMQLERLSDGDLEYLKKTLTETDWCRLHGDKDGLRKLEQEAELESLRRHGKSCGASDDDDDDDGDE